MTEHIIQASAGMSHYLGKNGFWQNKSTEKYFSSIVSKEVEETDKYPGSTDGGH